MALRQPPTVLRVLPNLQWEAPTELEGHVFAQILSWLQSGNTAAVAEILQELGSDGTSAKNSNGKVLPLPEVCFWRILWGCVVQLPVGDSRYAHLARMVKIGNRLWAANHPGKTLKYLDECCPPINDWFKKKPDDHSWTESVENIMRKAYFLGHLASQNIVPELCDELFAPCVSLITLPSMEPFLLNLSADADHQTVLKAKSNYNVWASQIRIAAFWIHAWARRYLCALWDTRSRDDQIGGGKRELPYPLHASYGDDQKWEAWLAWRTAFKNTRKFLPVSKKELIEIMDDALLYMNMLEEKAGERAEWLREVEEARSGGVEIVPKPTDPFLEN